MSQDVGKSQVSDCTSSTVLSMTNYDTYNGHVTLNWVKLQYY